MAQLPNSPPSAVAPKQPTGPVFNESVAKVRVTPANAVDNYEFNGKTFDREGEPVAASSLGWDHSDLAAAEANPSLVIERYDKDGKLIKKNGVRYPTVGELTPRNAPAKKDQD